jgi:hypothetical protein
MALWIVGALLACSGIAARLQRHGEAVRALIFLGLLPFLVFGLPIVIVYLVDLTVGIDVFD